MNNDIINSILKNCYFETRPSEEQLRCLPENVLENLNRWNIQIRWTQNKVRWALMNEQSLIDELVSKVDTLKEFDNQFMAGLKNIQSSVSYGNGHLSRKTALIHLLEKFS